MASASHSAAKSGSLHRARHLGRGLERGKIHAGEPRVWPEQLHVERMMLASPEHAGLVRIPAIRIVGRPGIGDRTPDVGPITPEPCVVAGVAPLAIGLDGRAEMTVGAGADDVEARPQRQALAKGEAAIRQLVVGELRLAQAFSRARERARRAPADSSKHGCSFLRRSPRRCAGLPSPKARRPRGEGRSRCAERRACR